MAEPRYKVVNGEYIELSQSELDEMAARGETADLDLRHVRSQRDGQLRGSDWTQGADTPLTAEKVAEWATYRQALRDYPAQSDKVSTLPDWPTPPE
jgi:hypothetical protein